MGFGSDDEDFQVEADDEERDATVVPLREHHHQEAAAVEASVVKPAATPADEQPAVQTDNKQLLGIFDGVLAIFNEAQPQFIRDCLDREAQRRYLFNALDNSLKEYLSHLGDNARREAHEANREEREKMMNDMASLRKREQQVEQSLAEQQANQLSDKRQKRALTQRNQDLEKQVATLEGEREQYQLEIKSLMNKLRLAELRGGDEAAVAAVNEEIEELRKTVTANNAENTRLNMTLKQRDDEMAALNKQITELNARIEELSAEAEGERITEEDRRIIADVEQQIARFDEIKKAKDEKISAQARKLTEAAQEAEQLRAQLAKAQEELVHAQEQLALAQTLNARDAAIAADNVPGAEEIPAAAVTTQPRRRGRRKNAAAVAQTVERMPKVSAIDDNIGSVDWVLTAPTAEDNVKMAAPSSPDPDFGYQPPVKRDLGDNAAQLTLF